MFDPTTLTGIHTDISLLAILAGLPVVSGLIAGRSRPVLEAVFLVLAVATSVTGFLFPFNGVLPSHVVGAIALLVLAAALYARYGAGLAGSWRAVHAGSAVASLYFLVFVGVAQAFGKIPALHAAAPTQSEPPFAVAQGAVLVAFIALGLAAVRAQRPVARMRQA